MSQQNSGNHPLPAPSPPNRRRSLRRRLLSGLVVVILLTPIVVRMWCLQQVPKIGSPFDINEFIRSSEITGENAFDHYRRAYAMLMQIPRPAESRPSADEVEAVYQQGWGAASDTLIKWVEARHDCLQEWKLGTECPDAQFTSLTKLDANTQIPVIDTLLDFARLAQLEAMQREFEGDIEKAEDWYLAILRSSNHVTRRGGIEQCQVGLQLYSGFFNGTLRWAEDSRVTTEQLRRVQNEHQQYLKTVEPTSTVLKTEYVSIVNTLKRSDWLRSSGLAWGVESSSVTDFVMRGYYWMVGEPEIARRVLDHVIANQLCEIDKQYCVQQPQVVSFFTLLFQLDPKRTSNLSQATPNDIEEIAKRSAVARHFLTPRVNFLESAIRSSQVKRVITEGVLAAQIYAREQGEFPDTLDSLMPQHLLAQLTDPMDKTGLTLRYQRASTSAGIIYSVGYNGTDEGGHILRASPNFSASVDSRSGTNDLGVHFRIR